MSSIPELQTPSAPQTCEYGYTASGPTRLKCAKCELPLMVKDAKRTPTGYVCPNYVKGRVAMAYNANTTHYIVAVLIALVLGGVAGFALNLIGGVGFFSIILMTFAGPFAGGVIAEAIRRTLKAMGNARGQYVWLASAIAVGVGASPFILLPALSLLARGGFALSPLIAIYGLVVTIGALVARLRI
jgi:hypothetical protein